MNKRHVSILAGLLVVAAGMAEDQPPANSILVIQPYRYADTWVFDDAQADLKQEPFIAGVPEILDKMVADIPDAEKGFRLLFSARDFPGATKFLLRRPEKGGNWYYSVKYEMEGWLCPSLFKYFKQPPSFLYAKAEPLKKPQSGSDEKAARKSQP